jgi:uncharacterized protein (DUF1330 family)
VSLSAGITQTFNFAVYSIEVCAHLMLTLRERIMKSKYTIAFAMFASFALGAAAVQGLHAQAKPPAYSVAEITVTNQDGYNKEYVPPVVKAIQEGGGKFIARNGRTISFEGAAPAPRVVLIQWESLDKAQALQNSSTYKDAQKIGQKYATFRIFGVEGLAQ